MPDTTIINQSAESRLDELAKDPKALEAQLHSEVEQIDTAAGKTADQRTDTPDPQKNAPSKDGGDQATDKTTDDTKIDGEGKKPNRFEKILADRNEARSAAAKAQNDGQAKDQQIADLTKAVNDLKLKIEGTGDDKTSTENATEKKPGEDKRSLDEIVAEQVAKALGKQNESVATAKADADEIEALSTSEDLDEGDRKVAGESKDKIAKLMQTHPTISAYAAYMILKGMEATGGDADPGSNANRTSTGNRSKQSLRQGKKPKDMTSAELDAAVRQGIKDQSIIV